MKTHGCLALALTTAAFAAGCGSAATPTTHTDAGVTNVVVADTPTATGGGTCESPIDLTAAGTLSGGDLVYRGSTAGRTNVLHPYEGCVARDAEEAVLRYHVPAGIAALMITSEGSAYDTAVYVRTACSQATGGTDVACNNDSFDHAPQSTVFVTNAIEGQVLFIVVDGNVVTDSVSQGAFVLTVRPVAFGALGMPCHPMTDPPTARCTGTLRCSEGGAADGTAICVPTVPNGAHCDARLFSNICLEGSSCVTDPVPMEGTAADSICALPGTRRAAPCRTAEPRCDAPHACSAGDTPICVPVMGIGIGCDPDGAANRCVPGATCSALGAGGAAICH